MTGSHLAALRRSKSRVTSTNRDPRESRLFGLQTRQSEVGQESSVKSSVDGDDSESSEAAAELEAEERKAQAKQREQLMENFQEQEIFGDMASMTNKERSLTQRTVDKLRRADTLMLSHLASDIAHRGPMMVFHSCRGVARDGLLLLPTSNFRVAWDLACIVLVLYIAFMLPYRLAFVSTVSLAVADEYVIPAPGIDPHAVIDFFIDLFFLIDIILNFFTAYYIDGDLITSKRAIARNYLGSWLVPDLVSSIPFDWIVFGIDFNSTADVSASLQLLRVIKTIKLLRLLRVSRIYRYIQKLQEHMVMSSGVVRLIMITSVMALFAHWNGCLQYLLATFDGLNEFATVRTWNGGSDNITVVVFQEDSWVARMERAGMITSNNAWAWSFFTAISQMLAISVGIMPPMRDVELWGYLMSILVGALFYGFFVAALTAVVSELNASGRAYASKLDMVNQYMRHSKLPRHLRSKVRSYFEVMYPSKRAFNESTILGEVCKPLRQEIALYKCQGVLDGLLGPLSGDRLGPEGREASRLGALIAQRLERVVYVAGDMIIQEGEDSEGMFFVSAGLVAVLGAKGEVLTTLGQHAFFGEMALLHPEGRSVASVRVETFCEGYHLSKVHYLELESTHPRIRDYIESVAKLRLKRRAKQIKAVRNSVVGSAGVDELFSQLHLGESRHEMLRREIHKARREKPAQGASPQGLRDTAVRIGSSFQPGALRNGGLSGAQAGQSGSDAATADEEELDA